MTCLPTPGQLLGVSGLDEWRTGQADVFNKLMDWYYSPSRFMGMAQPTGGGKSVCAMLLASVSGARTVILTATKGLQDQLTHDFGSISATVRGQNNFRCNLVPSLRADEGPCHDGYNCSYSHNGGCTYRDQLRKALQAKIVITNYSYYLAQTRYSTGLGDVQLLILDEGHQAFSSLENHLNVSLTRMDIESLGLEFPEIPNAEPITTMPKKRGKVTHTDEEVSEGVETPEQDKEPDIWGIWKSWAGSAELVVQDRVDELAAEVLQARESNQFVSPSLSKAYRTAKSILAKLVSISSAKGDWVIQRANHGYLFTPRWVSSYGDELFGKVPKVMVMSAILSQKTADSIGIPQGEERSWIEVGSYFPPENTPIWHIPTARINYRTDDYGTAIWLARIDQIIQRRLDRKGIVFTVSYERARLLLANSRFKDIMFTHSTGDVTQVVNRFKAMQAPAVLVSPSVTTGWDFPGLNYIVQGKIPYPDTTDPVTHARHLDDKDWLAFMAMDVLVQSLGRGTRSAQDRCECLIVDDAFKWFYWNFKHFAPKWFQDRVKGSLTCVPEPLV